MSGRIYSATFSGSAQTAAIDFFEINAASTKVVELLSVHLSQGTELADAQEEQLLVLIKTGATVSGSGGSTPTAIPRHLGDAAFAGTVETANTTKANTGTIVTHHSQYWNIRVPLDIVFTPETTIWVPPSGRLTVELSAAPADSVTFGGTAVFREVG